MVKVNSLVLGPLQTNCYVVHEENSTSCVVVDPAHAPEKILEFTAARGLTIEAILLTHGHFDHVGAVERIVGTTGCALWMCKSDWSQFPNPVIYPIANCDFCEVNFCEDGETIRSGGLTFQVIATPGHTPGSVCYRCGGVIFSGDTLFAGGCGRTDLPGGNPGQLMHSLGRLAAMEADLTVYPGHGESTTLAAEKQYNPYMR